MSTPFTPDQERQIRARFGSDVQSLCDLCGEGPSAPTVPAPEGLVFLIHKNEMYLMAICAAANWLRNGAPGRALETLEKAMEL